VVKNSLTIHHLNTSIDFSSSKNTLLHKNKKIAKRVEQSMTSLAMFSKSLATNLDFEAMLLAFVISIQRYTKVDNNNPLTLFHRKFWMKSMANDEVKWHSVQP